MARRLRAAGCASRLALSGRDRPPSKNRTQDRQTRIATDRSDNQEADPHHHSDQEHGSDGDARSETADIEGDRPQQTDRYRLQAMPSSAWILSREVGDQAGNGKQ